MSDREYAPVPWKQGNQDDVLVTATKYSAYYTPPEALKYNGGYLICLGLDRDSGTMRRIIACVHACEGMSTELLEKLSLGCIAQQGHALMGRKNDYKNTGNPAI